MEELQAEAQEELEDDDLDRDDGKPVDVIEHYQDAWESAQDALEEQAEPP